jgi:DNA-binding beta-propeller fold protein YncE
LLRQYAKMIVLGTLAFAVTPLARAQTAPPQFSVTTIPLSGDGRWDYAIVGSNPHLLYITRQTHVQVFDVEQNKLLADIKNTAGVHGVALAPDLNRGFASDGQAGQVTIFDLKSNATLGTVKAGQNPDAILYDPASHKVFAFNGRSQNATIFDAATDPSASPKTTTLALDGKPEFAATDTKGHVYVNLEDKNEVLEIDSQQMKVTQRWKLEDAEEPSGLAIDVAGHHLFAGCGNEKMAIVDTMTGKTIGTAPIGKGVDACGFDPETKLAFASCGDGTLSVIAETMPGHFERVQTVKTRAGARTMALDPATHTIYLVAAEMTAGQGGGRATAKAGSFMLVIVKPVAPSR